MSVILYVMSVCESLFSRNNLTVFDMVTLQGYGARELLRVGGKLPGPGTSLRFNVPQSTLMECRDGELLLNFDIMHIILMNASISPIVGINMLGMFQMSNPGVCH